MFKQKFQATARRISAINFNFGKSEDIEPENVLTPHELHGECFRGTFKIFSEKLLFRTHFGYYFEF